MHQVQSATPQANAPVLAQVPSNPSPKAIYDALRNSRREIVNQIEDAQNLRQEIASQLRDGATPSADKAGLQQRLATIDQRLATLDGQKAEADAAVAKQAAVPGAVVPDQIPRRNGPPDEVYFLTGMFMVVVLLPLSIAWARRIWRRGAPVVTALPKEIYDRFTRVEQTLDTIAIEVERVGEGQRFLTRMQSQQAERALGAGVAEPVETASREKERQGRK